MGSLRPKKNKKGMDVSIERTEVSKETLTVSTMPIFRSSIDQHPVSTTRQKKRPKSLPHRSVPHSELPKASVARRLKNRRKRARSAKAMMEKANRTRLNNSLLRAKLRSKSSRSRNRLSGVES